MFLSTEFIQKQYPYVFKNECNEREIVGSHKKVERVLDQDYLRDKYNFVNIDKKLLLTQDKNGVVECFAFFQDFKNNKFCYYQVADWSWKNLDFKKV